MKHGIVIEPVFNLNIEPGFNLNYGQTVDIINSDGNGMYLIHPHGNKRSFLVNEEYIQIAEDLYDYTTNPIIVNT